MRVLCIDVSHPKHFLEPHMRISVGEVYHVIASYFHDEEGEIYYYLEERLQHPRASYRANRFIRLSDEEDAAHREESISNDKA